MPGEDTVKDQAWIGERSRLYCFGEDSTCIWRIGCAEVRVHDVVVRAIRLAVSMHRTLLISYIIETAGIY